MANRLDHSGTFEMTLAGACVCVRRHTIKTSGHEGAVTESQLHLEEVKELHGQTRLRVKKGGGGTALAGCPSPAGILWNVN